MYFQILPIPEKNLPFTYTHMTTVCSSVVRGPVSMPHGCGIGAGQGSSACAPGKPACVVPRVPLMGPQGMFLGSCRGSEICVRPGLEAWNIMEGLEEVWKSLGYGAWNILTLIYHKRSVLHAAPVDKTFSTKVFPTGDNTQKCVCRGQEREPGLQPHAQVGSSDSALERPVERQQHRPQPWASLISFFTNVTQRKYQEALELLNQAAKFCQLGTVPVPAGKEQDRSTIPRVTCSSRH